MIRIEYLVENDKWSDQLWSQQDENVFIITEDMIVDLIERNVALGENRVDRDNLYVSVL